MSTAAHTSARQLAAYALRVADPRGGRATSTTASALLPREKREAMCAVYAFARRVDDIGDGELRVQDKRALLDEQAQRWLSARRRSRADDPVMLALADLPAAFRCPRTRCKS